MKKTPRTRRATTALVQAPDAYADFASDIAALLDEARLQAARSINAVLTATYWEIGRRIVEFEQRGQQRAEYGEEVLIRLSQDLTAKFKRGFSRQNLQQMRQFYLVYSLENICQTLSGKSEMVQTLLAKITPLGDHLTALAQAFPLSWSHYVRLLSVRTPEAGHSTKPKHCSERGAAVARYALDNMLNNIMATEYRLALPDPKQLEEEIEKTRLLLQSPVRGDEHADT